MAKINEAVLANLQVALITGKISDGEFAQLAGNLDKAGFRSLIVAGPPAIAAFEMQNKKDLFSAVTKASKVVSSTPLKICGTAAQINSAGFVEKAAKAGVKIFKVADASNNTENLKKAISLVGKADKQCEGAVFYNVNGKKANALEVAEKLKGFGCKAICLMDDSGTLTPKEAKAIVSQIKSKTNLPCGISVIGNNELAGAVYFSLMADGVDGFDSTMLKTAERNHVSTDVLSALLNEAGDKNGLNAGALKKSNALLDEMLGKGAAGMSTALKSARAYDIAVEGQSYHVEIHPSKIGATIKAANSVAPATTAAPKAVAGRPAPAGASSRPAPAGAAASAKPAPVAKPKAAPKPVKKSAPAPSSGGSGNITCSMQGTITKLLVKEGDTVERGQLIAVLEAMKMENDVLATASGTVTKVNINAGDTVQTGQTLLTIG